MAASASSKAFSARLSLSHATALRTLCGGRLDPGPQHRHPTPSCTYRLRYSTWLYLLRAMASVYLSIASEYRASRKSCMLTLQCHNCAGMLCTNAIKTRRQTPAAAYKAATFNSKSVSSQKRVTPCQLSFRRGRCRPPKDYMLPPVDHSPYHS